MWCQQHNLVVFPGTVWSHYLTNQFILLSPSAPLILLHKHFVNILATLTFPPFVAYFLSCMVLFLVRWFNDVVFVVPTGLFNEIALKDAVADDPVTSFVVCAPKLKMTPR